MSIELLQQLKQWRDKQALREGREAYFVFPNKTLEETVSANPQTSYDLLQIKGWGEKKVAKYGKQVLQILQGEEVNEQTSLFRKKDIDINIDINNTNIISNPEIPIFSVVGFLDQVNDIFSRMGMVKIRGELHDINERAGNVYLHLKDLEQGDSLLSCFVSRWVVEYYQHLLVEGADVVIFARPSVYKTGRFTLLVDRIEPVGEGGHRRALELLKKKLAERGLFDETRKRSLAPYLKKIGIITSLSGAAIQDFKKNVGAGGYEFVLEDVRVEGDLAEQSIIRAIQEFNVRRPELDLLLLMRGGGSVENMKAFNSELLVEALVSSRIPIMTAIGHEKDVSIADLVADVSCSTPTAAANYIRGQRERLIHRFSFLTNEVLSRIKELILESQHNVYQCSSQVVRSIQDMFVQARFRFDRIVSMMAFSFQRVNQQFSLKERQVGDIAVQLQKQIEYMSQQINVAETIAYANNPLRLLEKGYSIVYNKKGVVVQTTQEVEIGEKIRIQLKDGIFYSRVVEKYDKTSRP